MSREAWFCPACQKHHAPHVDTCPGVTVDRSDPWGLRYLPQFEPTHLKPVTTWPVTLPDSPSLTGDPLPAYPTITCGVADRYVFRGEMYFGAPQ